MLAILTDCLLGRLAGPGSLEVELGVSQTNVRAQLGDLKVLLVLALHHLALDGQVGSHVRCNTPSVRQLHDLLAGFTLATLGGSGKRLDLIQGEQRDVLLQI